MSPVSVSAIGSFLREQREQAKLSVLQLAQVAGVPAPYLTQLERGLRKPSADVLQQVARGLRISAEALYGQGAVVAGEPGGVAVRESVLADPGLTERQKQMLIEVYESFRRETSQAAERAAEAASEPGTGPAAEPGPDEPASTVPSPATSR
ncbi:MAG: helix-turn-helix transcriptional regulator [Actinomycetota bacterium]